MVNIALVVEGVGAAPRAINQLVEDNKVPRLDLAAERPSCTRTENLLNAEGAHGPQVRFCRNLAWAEPMSLAVASNESDPALTHARERDGTRRWSVGCIDVDEFDVVEKLVETRPAEDADRRSLGVPRFRAGVGRAHGVVEGLLEASLDDLELEESELLLDVELDEESLELLSDLVVELVELDELSLSFDFERDREREESLLSVL